MKKRAPDRRTEKTRRALKAVLIRLLQTRSLQKVSISELTELADISRGTFYLHYRDIFDLYQTIQNEVVQGIAAIVAQTSPTENEDVLERMISSIFEYLAANIDACEALLRTDSASFLSQIFDVSRPNSPKEWRVLFGDDEQMRAYAYVFISYGCAGMLKHWIDNGKREEPREISRIVKQLVNCYVYPGQKR